MANKELREWRMKAHAAIDPLYKSGRMKRGTLYARLGDFLGKEVHIGWSDIEDCKAIIHAAEFIGNQKHDRVSQEKLSFSN